MDEEKTTPKSRWSWVPQLMPGVQRLMAERRREWGDAHVNECWQRGVVQREPGWFFAAEGALTLGTPDTDQRALWFAALGPVWTGTKGARAETPAQALLDMRRPGA